ncbi:MAG: TetR family transcriptional regulator C-terminal domain-containing protein [Alphaproteobacteria bacterium]
MRQTVSNSTGGSRVAAREARRQQLINATIDSISKRGFSGTTLTTVTKGAKLSHGVVNFYFDSKEALYNQTLEYLANEHYEFWHKAMQEAPDNSAAQLSAMLSADFDPKICSPRKLAVWFAFWGQAKYRPSYLKIYNAHDEQRYVEIHRLCEKIIAEGKYRSITPGAAARSLEALIDGQWLSLLMYPDWTTPDEARSDIGVYLASVFPKHFDFPEAQSDSKRCGLKTKS